MKKQLNEAAIMSELREGSVFFQRPTPLPVVVERPGTPPPPQARPDTPHPLGIEVAPAPLPRENQVSDSPATETALDLAAYPTKTVTFPVTEQESLVLDELKLDITRTYQPSITATKEKLLRLAIHYLVDDFRRNGDKSFAVQRLTKKSK